MQNRQTLLLLFSIYLWALLTACGVRIQEVKPDSATSYRHYSDINGLRASADLFADEARLETYFGDNLLKNGILPVFIVFENNRAKNGYVLLREQSKLTMKRPSNNSNDISFTDVMENNSVERPGSGAVMLLPAAPLVLGPAVGLATIFVAAIIESNIEKVFHNIEEKQMVDRAVYPGERHSGFIYFKVKEDEVEKIGGVILTVQNLKTQELEQLIISLK